MVYLLNSFPNRNSIISGRSAIAHLNCVLFNSRSPQSQRLLRKIKRDAKKTSPYPIEGLKPSSNSNRSSLRAEDENYKPIVEAQGWIVNDRGKVELVAHNASNTKSKIAQRAVSEAMPEGLIACQTD